MLRFGTDGVRGLANVELTPELVLALGRAAARVLASPPGSARRFIVGRDTRRSGPLLQAALSAGLASEGVDVTDVGVLATPAVAYLSAEQAAPAAVISASHNRYWDNGVKFFSSGGSKLPDVVEDALEAELEVLLSQQPGRPAAQPSHSGPPAGLALAPVGLIDSDPDALERYERHVLSALEGRRLGGLRVALDCANGAAFASAPAVFQRAGAELVAVLAAEPNGTNINEDCGSTDPGQLARAVVAEGADLGLAFDGDADRVIAVDASGNVVDGDRLLALFATDLAGRSLLAGGTVVVTVMTNIGFHQAMRAAGVNVETVGVGDRNVLEALDSHGWALGGEQSGHIVFRSLATTGDGVLSGLLLADLITRKGGRLEDMAAGALERFPQVLRNVAVQDRDGLKEAKAVWGEVQKVEAELGGGGRVLLRPSGTEPLVRVMVEAPSLAEAEAAAERIVAALHATLGSPTA
jgi:phosphoglucosamine mutase